MAKFRYAAAATTLTGALAFAAASANAADISRSVAGYKDGPVYAPVATWTGFYAGVNVGDGWAGNGNGGVLSPSGGFGGVQVGYNWQGVFGLGPNVVLGIEADFQGSGIEDSGPYLKSSLNWFSTVRGRVGYAFGPALVYATGGFAFGEVENTAMPIRVTETQTGYAVGGGLEYKFNPSWSLKGEYQFISLDASDPFGAGPLGLTSGNRSEVNTVRVGLNYHFGRGFDPLK
jgi:outer membrane immunogenic protein